MSVAALCAAVSACATPQWAQSSLVAYVEGEAARRPAMAGAVLVADGDHVLLATGYGFADRERGIRNQVDTRFLIASVTKVATAAAVLRLRDQRRLRIEDGICPYLFDEADACPQAWRTIRIADLLSHQSGFGRRSSPFEGGGPFDPTPATVVCPTPEAALETMRAMPLTFPDRGYHYSNTGYMVLGYIIERASGRPFAEAMRMLVFEPAGMSNTGVYNYSSALPRGALGYRLDPMSGEIVRGQPPEYCRFAAGGLYSTVVDLFRLDRALRDNSLLSTSSWRAMSTRQARSDGDNGYGYGLELRYRSGQLVEGHVGAGGLQGFNAEYRHFDDGVIVIVLANMPEAPPDFADRLHDLAIAERHH